MPSSYASDYILHLRPRSWAIVALHCLVGAAMAWLTGAAFAPLTAIFAALIWAVCLNGGTLALNSAVDRDDGDIGYLDNPPPAPPALGRFGMMMMLAGAVLSLFINAAFFWLYLFNWLLSIVYSVPPLRFKARAGADVCINALGYGLSTFLAGWLSQAGGAGGLALMTGLGFAFLFAGFYPLTQIYQYEDDRRSGAATLTVALGPARALRFAAVFIHAAFAAFILGFWFSGRIIWPALLLGGAWWLWWRMLGQWPARRTRRAEKAGMYEALYLWALTDCVILLSAVG